MKSFLTITGHRSGKLQSLMRVIGALSLTVMLCWLGLQALKAETFAPTVSVLETTVQKTPLSVQEASAAQGLPIGVEVTFTVNISNSGSDWLSVLPISLTYDSTYLKWIRGEASPDNVAAGSIRWNDLTETEGNIQPGQEVTLLLTFETLAATVALPDGNTIIDLLISDVKGDPDGNGPKGDELSLPDRALAIPVQIDGEPIPTETPTATITPTETVTTTPTVTPTPSGAPTQLAKPLGIERSPDAVTVSWQTADETNIIGFNLTRRFASGARIQVNDALIAAQHSGEPIGDDYVIVDDGFSLLRDSVYELEIALDSADSEFVEMGILDAVSIIIAHRSVGLTDEGLTVEWSTVDETYMTGFDLLRYDLPTSPPTSTIQLSASEPPLTQVNESTIAAFHSGDAQGKSYKFTDLTSRIGGGGGYGYRLRILLRNGENMIVDVGEFTDVAIKVNTSPVEFGEDGATIYWLTFDELVIEGFNILRRDVTNASQSETQLNRDVISATMSGARSGAQYRFLDTTADPYHSYVYIVEVLLIDNSAVRYELEASEPLRTVFLPLISN